MSMNQVILIGRLASDAQIREAGGKLVANFTIATNESWTDKGSGERQERSEFTRCSYFSNSLRAIGNSLTKGRMVSIVGRLQTRNFETREGSQKEVTEVVAIALELLDRGATP